MLDKTHTVPTTTCPKCGVIVDRATNAEGMASPSVDDFSICFTCATICRYNSDLSLRVATNQDLQILHEDQPDDFETMLHVQKEIKRFRLNLIREN